MRLKKPASQDHLAKGGAGGAPRDYLDRLQETYDAHMGAIDELVERAKTDNDRDLTPEEDAEVSEHTDEAEGLLEQIERWNKLRETRRSGVQLRERLAPAHQSRFVPDGDAEDDGADEGPEIPAEFKRMSTGDWLKTVVRAKSKGDPKATDVVQRALAKITTVETPGLLPTVALFSDNRVLGKINGRRRLVDASNKVPLPATGNEFKIPRITDHTTVDVQTTEKTEVASSQFKVTFDDFGFDTLAGAVNMSIQDIERTSPEALTLVFEDLAAKYGKKSEALTAATLNTSVTGITPVGGTNTVDDYIEALFAASAEIAGAMDGEMPDRVYASLDMWAKLAAMAKAINPSNQQVSYGSLADLSLTIGPLPVTVSPALPTGTLITGIGDYLVTSERPGSPVELKALEVGILGWEVGVYGLFGAAVTMPAAFRKLTVNQAQG